jgi:hypothetical protein
MVLFFYRIEMLAKAEKMFQDGDNVGCIEIWESMLPFVSDENHYILYTNCGVAYERM